MSTHRSLQFEGFSLDLDRLCLHGPTGQADLRRKSFEVLRYLAGHAGRVVTKEELIKAVWPDVTVGDESLTQCVSEVRRALGHRGQHIIKTIARRGYLMDVSVSPDVTAVRPSAAATAGSLVSPLPDKPSIAVLPFTNMSGDPHQEYFSDGITEDIITELSRLRWFFVIARNSTFVYKGQVITAKDVGRDLGVRYILEGSVRKAGLRVRISSQLVDVRTGGHIWAERYDRRLTDIFAVQDEITASVAAAIEPELLAAEGMRAEARSVDDLDAWDLVARALWHFWRLTAAESEVAVALLRQAVERYPNYAPAHSMLAPALTYSAYVGWTPAGRDNELAAQLARRAMELDDGDPRAYLALGYLAIINRETDNAVRHIKVALTRNPNFATAYRTLAWALVLGGRPEEAVRYCDHAIRLNPRDETGLVSALMAGAHYQAGRYTDAVRCAKDALEQRPGFIATYRILCASLAQAGEIEEARSAMRRLRQLHPTISIAWIKQWVPYTAEPMAHFLDGLRKAGLPES
jgi:TolB-like protein